MSEQASPTPQRIVSAPLLGTESAALAIDRVKYSHDAMIDMIIANPGVHQNALAKHFGYTAAWVSRIINSDAFQARLAVRKADIVDPSLVMSVEERLNTLADRSLTILHEKLELTQNPDMALKAADLSLRALGYGARQANVAIQQNFVVAMPAKATSGAEWAQQQANKLANMTAAADVVENATVVEK